MKPGEHRLLRHISDNQLAETELTAREEENVWLPAGELRLLRIDQVERLPNGQEIKGAVWIDREGEVRKSWAEPLDMETFRVSRETALAEPEPARVDLGWDVSVRLDRPLPHAHRTKRGCYRVHLDGADPATVFPNSPSQQVRRLDAHTAEVTVYAIRPGVAGNPQAPNDPPTDADRRPNNFIQSDYPQIVADARQAAAGQTDPWQVAIALERYVHGAIVRKGYARAFATAAEAARTHEGDCKAHAVYLAALARAYGLPARVAGGLVYMAATQVFAYHMWTEVYIDGRWIPLDGTLGTGGIGGGHLTLIHSNLAGLSALSGFVPILKVIERLRVELLDVE